MQRTPNRFGNGVGATGRGGECWEVCFPINVRAAKLSIQNRQYMWQGLAIIRERTQNRTLTVFFPTVFFFFYCFKELKVWFWLPDLFVVTDSIWVVLFFFANISGVYYDNRYSSAFRAFDRFTTNESLNISATLEHLSQYKYTSQPTSKQLAAMLRQKCQWMPVRCYIKLLSAFPQVSHLGEKLPCLESILVQEKAKQNPSDCCHYNFTGILNSLLCVRIPHKSLDVLN